MDMEVVWFVGVGWEWNGAERNKEKKLKTRGRGAVHH